MELAKKVGDKLDAKIKSGEIKESELLEEASQYMSNLKDMPGAEGMKDLLSKFGLNNMSKAQTGAMKSEMDRRVSKSKQQERMRAELERRQLEKAKKLLEEQQRAATAPASTAEPEKPQKTKRNKKK
jgi:spore cortex formation protein SpoVR/YcgB (stage V sporulation)